MKLNNSPYTFHEVDFDTLKDMMADVAGLYEDNSNDEDHED